jgi:hypothetical protein
MNNLPKIPLNALIGGLGALSGVAGLSYVGWNSIYSGSCGQHPCAAPLRLLLRRAGQLWFY